MPYRRRKIVRRRRRVIRRVTRRKIRVARPMKPLVYNFKRSFVDNIQLNATVAPDGWYANTNGIYQTNTFNLGQVNDPLDFTNLFASYRILAAKQQYYFSNSVSEAPGNTQLIMYMKPNRTGAIYTNTPPYSPLREVDFLDTQSYKKRLCLSTNGHPVSVYQKVHQLQEVYHNIGNTDYAVAKPKFISTGEYQTPHYGMDCRIQRVDGEPFSEGTTDYPHCKIITTIYFQCRQVQ